MNDLSGNQEEDIINFGVEGIALKKKFKNPFLRRCVLQNHHEGFWCSICDGCPVEDGKENGYFFSVFGTISPNLDRLVPDYQSIAFAICNGCLKEMDALV